MTVNELKTLRGQILLMAGLFAFCTALAGVLASQRAFFERHIYERYGALDPAAQPIVEAAGRGKVSRRAYEHLSDAQRLSLYDFWMSQAQTVPAELPAALAALEPDLYIYRAERTLVCGNMDQRWRAVAFLARCGNRQATDVLLRADRQAMRRGEGELRQRIAHALDELRGTRPAGAFSPASTRGHDHAAGGAS